MKKLTYRADYARYVEWALAQCQRYADAAYLSAVGDGSVGGEEF